MRSPLLLPVALASLAATTSAQTIRQVLTSTKRDVHVEDWSLTHEDVDFTSTGPWSIAKHMLHGGKQEGIDVISMDNGVLQLVIVPTRGMSVLRVTCGDVRLGWDSPVHEVVHPKHIDLQSRGGLGWLEGFNEWLVRCGLEWAGHPGTDRFVDNVGNEATMELTLHGRIGNTPASEVEVLIDRKPPHRITVRGRVDERSFYGPQLELWTEVSTEPGSSRFRIHDVVTNRRGQEQEFQIIYHANFGPPILERDAQLVAPVRRVTPFNDHAAKSIGTFDRYPGPTPGFIEQVYCIELHGDAEGRTLCLLRNAAGTKAVSLEYSLRELPYLTLWKNALPLTDGYVTGVEPGTGFPSNRSVERRAGRVPVLAAGASREFTIEFGIHTDSNLVRGVADRIDELRANRVPQVDERPADIKVEKK